ncbi:hypothetical protein Esti_005166 [Eimeria stiedai]
MFTTDRFSLSSKRMQKSNFPGRLNASPTKSSRKRGSWSVQQQQQQQEQQKARELVCAATATAARAAATAAVTAEAAAAEGIDGNIIDS